MKNILIVLESKLKDHAGEEYDEIVHASPRMDTQHLSQIGISLRHLIRQVAGPERDEVELVIDATPLYRVVALSLMSEMAENEGITVRLPDDYEPMKGTKHAQDD